MATAEDVKMNECGKEGKNLLGSPKFKQLENGRFRCVETGHELPHHAMDSYSNSKRCRLGLIDFALSKNKSPLNMFTQDPLSRKRSSKLICKLTGDTVNKSEEHIWMHINGKHFLSKLEQMEAGNLPKDGKVEEKEGEQDKENGIEKKSKKKKQKKKEKEMSSEKKMEEIISEVRETPNDSDSEEPEFWMPPIGARWDFDDGKDRWGLGSESEGEHEENNVTGTIDEEEDTNASAELSTRTKRMSIEVGPSSFASRKKKNKTKS